MVTNEQKIAYNKQRVEKRKADRAKGIPPIKQDETKRKKRDQSKRPKRDQTNRPKRDQTDQKKQVRRSKNLQHVP